MATLQDGGGDVEEEAEVVMRKPKNLLGPSDRQRELDSLSPDSAAHKHVKWSESTDLREKLKVYRRSQLDMPLNYHHIAMEEAREKEGVKRWRESLQQGMSLAEADDRRPSIISLAARAAATVAQGDDDDDEDDDDEDVVDGSGGDVQSRSNQEEDACDEELERQLLLIRSKTTKFTILPAYSAAVDTYKDWLSSSKNTKEISEEKISAMKSQLKIYQKVVKVYKAWGDQSDDRSDHFDQISTLLQEASDLGPPPHPVAQTISDQLAEPGNVKRQVDNYNSLVQDLLTAREQAGRI